MSEPKSRAGRVEAVVPGVLHWSVHDDRIDWRSEAYAVVEEGGAVLIDPLPLEEGAIGALGKVEAICLTGSCHQRSAWRYRKRFGVDVWAPEGAAGLEDEPDLWYRAGDVLPGGLKAVHSPGPTEVHYAFHRDAGEGVLFCADVLLRDGARVRFVSDEHQDDPKRTRRTARGYLELAFGALCFAHGSPITGDPHRAILAALEGDAAS